MPYRYYEATHHDLNPKLGEYTRLEWAEGVPILGEDTQLRHRSWEIVALKYKSGIQSVESVMSK